MTLVHRNEAGGTAAELAAAPDTRRGLTAAGVGVVASDVALAGVDAAWLAANAFDAAFLCLWYYRVGAPSIPELMLPRWERCKLDPGLKAPPPRFF